MLPRQQTAGTLGLLAGITLTILFFVFMTSGLTPETLADPAKAVPSIAGAAGRFRAIGFLGVTTVALATVFTVGLAARLRDQTPSRATGALYFGVFGLAGHGVGSMVFWASIPLLVARAAADQASAGQAWVAINALTAAFDAFGNLFIGLSILMAGWAIQSSRVMSPALGSFGLVAGILTILAVASPGLQVLTLVGFVLPIVWLLWAGNTLRTAA
jgi:hypothetical protein